MQERRKGPIVVTLQVRIAIYMLHESLQLGVLHLYGDKATVILQVVHRLGQHQMQTGLRLVRGRVVRRARPGFVGRRSRFVGCLLSRTCGMGSKLMQDLRAMTINNCTSLN